MNRVRVSVALAQLSEETRCPICLGILRHTVVSEVCLHRFCVSCINTCLSGRPPEHKDCPVCRTNMHSHRSLRPDPNFDQLLEALYGDVVEYSKQEDAMVAARNAAQSARVAEQQQLRKAAREAQAAAATAARGSTHPPRCTSHSSGGLGTELPSGGQPATSHLEVAAESAIGQQPLGTRDSDIFTEAARAAGVRRARHSHPASGTVADKGDDGGGGAPNIHHESGDASRAPKRQRHQAAALTSTSPPLPPHPTTMVPTTGLHHRQDLGTLQNQDLRNGFHCSEIVPHTSPSHPSCDVNGVDAEGEQSPQLGAVPNCSVHSEAVGRRVVHTASSDSGCGGGRGAGGGGSGLLAVPTARSAAELSFRHAGMLVVQLLPGPDTRHRDSGGSGQEGVVKGNVHTVDHGRNEGSSSGSGGRAPALEKPFLLCPVGWTVGHIAQLLSQWLPVGQTAPGCPAAPGPPREVQLSDITLTPAPGCQPRGRCRHLRKCMGLGFLAAELLLGTEEIEPRRLGGVGTAAAAGGMGRACGNSAGHLVLEYCLGPC